MARAELPTGLRRQLATRVGYVLKFVYSGKMQTITPTIKRVLPLVQGFSAQERIALARWLLDSVLEDEEQIEADWMKMGLSSFEKDWDNPEDAIYDNWRIHYGISAG